MIPFYLRIFRIIFKISCPDVARPVKWPNRHISETLLACRHTLVSQNNWESVGLHHWRNLLMTASGFFIHGILLIFATYWTNKTQIFCILKHFITAFEADECNKKGNIMNFPFCKISILPKENNNLVAARWDHTFYSRRHHKKISSNLLF